MIINMNKQILATVAISLILIAGFTIYKTHHTNPINEGENCDPQTCAASTTKEFYDTNLKAGFKYLDNLYIDEKISEYVHLQEWPPTLSISTDTYKCDVSGNQVMQGGLTYTKNVDGMDLCATVQSEGAAGSTYTTYTYKKNYPDQNKIAIFKFVIRAPQCGNYDQPMSTNCEKEKQLFNADNMTAKVFKTLYFK